MTQKEKVEMLTTIYKWCESCIKKENCYKKQCIVFDLEELILGKFTTEDETLLKFVRNSENLYIISNIGRVFSLRTGKEILGVKRGRNRRICLTLSNGKKVSLNVNKEVEELFGDNAWKKTQINIKKI